MKVCFWNLQTEITQSEQTQFLQTRVHLGFETGSHLLWIGDRGQITMQEWATFLNKKIQVHLDEERRNWNLLND